MLGSRRRHSFLLRSCPSVPASIINVPPAVVGRAGTELLPGERCQSARIDLVTGLLRLPHDQIGDGFPLAQLIAVLKDWVSGEVTLKRSAMTFFCFGSGLNSMWPPRASGSDFPF